MAGDGPADEAGDWLSIAEAARREGVTPKAIRNRIEREQIAWRHAGNRGREVWLAARDGPGDAWGQAGDVPGTEALFRELAEARERAGAAEGELAGLREALAEARARAAEAGDRSRAAEAEAVRLAGLLADALRPWWWRWLDRDRSR